MNWIEFKPTLYFLGKFLSIYLIGNVLYGLYVTSYEPRPDPITRFVTAQTAVTLSFLGWQSETRDHELKPTTGIIHSSREIVTVYEGCNGLNVIIIFIAFIVSFGPVSKSMWWFIPMGIAIIHVMNLMRIGLLFLVSLEMPRYLYFTHKYLFTAFIYAIVFILWIVWVKVFSLHRKDGK